MTTATPTQPLTAAAGHRDEVQPRSAEVPAAARRVTFLCARYWPDQHGGVERRLRQVSLALAGAGCRVDVLTEKRDPQLSDSELLDSNLFVRRLAPLNAGRLWRVMDLMRVRWWCQAIGQSEPGGVIWATDPRMALAACLVGRGGDLVYNPAGCVAAMEHTARTFPQVHTMRTPALRRWLDRAAYRRAGRVVVGSVCLERQLARFYGPREPVHVVPHGVAPVVLDKGTREAFRLNYGVGPGEWVVGFVGRLDPVKDLGFLFQAFRRGDFCERGRVLIVGDGPDRSRLESIAQGYGIASRLIWAGRMDDPTPAYAAMDVLVLPSLHEMFGNVLVEAMAAGVPVIGRQGDGVNILNAASEIIDHGHNGYVVDGRDPTDLAGRLGHLAENPAECRSMSRHAVESATGRTWSRVAEDYLAILQATRSAP